MLDLVARGDEYPTEYVIIVEGKIVAHTADRAEAMRQYDAAFDLEPGTTPIMVPPEPRRHPPPVFRGRGTSWGGPSAAEAKEASVAEDGKSNEQLALLATSTVERLIGDLRGRAGFDGICDSIWDGADPGVQAEIEKTWASFVSDSIFIAVATGITLHAEAAGRLLAAQEPLAASWLAKNATRWSPCPGGPDCNEVVDRYDGIDNMPPIQEMPCGCGEHEVRLDRGPVIHWLGAHWAEDCAFKKAMKLLAKAVDAKEGDDG